MFRAGRRKCLVAPRRLGYSACQVRRIGTPRKFMERKDRRSLCSKAAVVSPLRRAAGKACGRGPRDNVMVAMSSGATRRVSPSAKTTVMRMRRGGSRRMKDLLLAGGKRRLARMAKSSILTGMGTLISGMEGTMSKGRRANVCGNFGCRRAKMRNTRFRVCTGSAVCSPSKTGSRTKGPIIQCRGSSLMTGLAASRGKATIVGGLPLKACCLGRIMTKRGFILGARRGRFALATRSSARTIICRNIACGGRERGIFMSMRGGSSIANRGLRNIVFKLCTTRSVLSGRKRILMRGSALLRGGTASTGKALAFSDSLPRKGCCIGRRIEGTKCLPGRRM